MSTKQPESKLVEKILRFLRSNYPGYWRKIHGGPYQGRGIPDILGCHRGRWFSFEAKMDGNKASAIQEDNGQEIQDAGGIWAVVWSVEEVKTTMEATFSEKDQKKSKRFHIGD